MKHVAAIIILCAVLLPASRPPAEAQATFIGLPDRVPVSGTPVGFKYLHFMAGLALGLSAAELVHALPLSPELQQDRLLFPGAALGASVLGGIAKELLDSTGFGDPAVADALVTMTGGLAAAAIVGYEQSLYAPGAARGTNEASFLLTSAAMIAVPVVIAFIGEIRRFIERSQARYE